MNYTPRLPRRNHNLTPVSPLRELLVLLGGLLAIIAALYLLLGLGADLLVSHISPATEQKLATIFSSRFSPSEKPTPEEKWLQSIVDTMEEKGCVDLPYPVTVQIADAKAINAVALPGGRIMVFSGLLNIIRSENEMAFILGHELGHFKHRDHLRGLGRGLVFAFLSTLMGSDESGIARLAARTVQVTESGFSREQEAAADAFGLQMINCVYGHAGGATDFFVHMPKKLDPGHIGHYFASHPENKKRIQALLALQQKNGYPSGPLTPLPHKKNSRAGKNQDGSCPLPNK